MRHYIVGVIFAVSLLATVIPCQADTLDEILKAWENRSAKVEKFKIDWQSIARNEVRDTQTKSREYLAVEGLKWQYLLPGYEQYSSVNHDRILDERWREVLHM